MEGDETYSELGGVFDWKEAGFERVRSLNSRFYSRGSEE
jgi:hypothetical protein